MNETELERLMVRLQGDGSSYQKMLRQAEYGTERFGANLRVQTKSISAMGLHLRGFATNAALGVGAVAGIGGALYTAKEAVQRFAEQEQTEIAFEALIGNAELAQKTLGDLRKFAAETPFESPEIMAAAKQMIAFGESANNIVPTMKALGDVSAGLNIPLGQLTYLYGTLKAQGRAMTVDINQFAMRGIPIWKELEKITGKSNAELRKMVEEGQVGFPLVEQAFKNMTAEGGLFHGQLEKQSQSLLGLFSTLKDNVGMALADIGKTIVQEVNLKGFIQDIGAAAQFAADWFRGLSPEVKKTAAAAAVATVVLGFLAGTIFLVGTAVHYATGGLTLISGILTLLVGAGIVGMVAGLTSVIVGVGGVAKAWGLVKKKAQEFWEFVRPVRVAVESLGSAVWKYVVAAWERAKQVVKELWDRVTGGVDWARVRDQVRDAVLFMEFSLENFGDVSELVWAGAKYYALVFANELEHLLTKTLPAAWDFYKDKVKDVVVGLWGWTQDVHDRLVQNLIRIVRNADWVGMWKGMQKVHYDVFKEMFDNSVSVFKSITDSNVLLKASAGLIQFTDLWKNASAKSVEASKQELLKLPEWIEKEGRKFVPPARIPTELEEKWRKEYEALGAKVGGSFAKFRDRKMAEFFFKDLKDVGLSILKMFLENPLKKEAAAANKELGKPVSKDLNIVPRFDAAGANTVEAAARIQEWQDRIGLQTVSAKEARGRSPIPTLDFSGERTTMDKLQNPDSKFYNPERLDPFSGKTGNVFDDIRTILKDIRDGKGSDGSDSGGGDF